jgi:hypothetical protein
MVTGLHDARWLRNAVDNFERQRREWFAQARGLILIENGNGLGVTDGTQLPAGTVVLRSDTGAAQPLNAALSWLRTNTSPDDWFCKCDSDDYYGPQYLESIHEAVQFEADYAGRCDMYIRTQSGHLWYQEQGLRGFCEGLANGPTLCARVSSAEDFPEVQYWGEDTLWCARMKELGNRFYALPPEHMCYQRWHDNEHAWPCTDTEIIAGCSVPFWDLGLWDSDIVDRVISRPKGTRIVAPPLTLETSMPYRILMEQLRQTEATHVQK